MQGEEEAHGGSYDELPGEIITIRGDEDDEDRRDYADDDDDDEAWHRARRGAHEPGSGDLPLTEESMTTGARGSAASRKRGTPPPTEAQTTMPKKKKRKKKPRRRGEKPNKQAVAAPPLVSDASTVAAAAVLTHQAEALDGAAVAAEAQTTHTEPAANMEKGSNSTEKPHKERQKRAAPATRREGREGARKDRAQTDSATGKRMPRGMKQHVVAALCQELMVEQQDKAVSRLAQVMHEKKVDKIAMVVRVLGMERTLRLFSQTMALERSGGMTVNVGKGGQVKRRTTGGVFFTLLTKHASKEELNEINKPEQERKRSGKRKRAGKGGKEAESSTSRIRAEDDAEDSDDERHQGNDFEIVEEKPTEESEKLPDLPDRITVELVRSGRGKRPKRTVTQSNDSSVPDGGSLETEPADDNPFGQVW